MLTTMGLDPITAGIVTSVAGDFLKSFFGGGSAPAPAGPSAAQIATLLEQQRQAAASRSNLLIGVGLAGAGVLAAILLLRRRR